MDRLSIILELLLEFIFIDEIVYVLLSVLFQHLLVDLDDDKGIHAPIVDLGVSEGSSGPVC